MFSLLLLLVILYRFINVPPWRLSAFWTILKNVACNRGAASNPISFRPIVAGWSGWNVFGLLASGEPRSGLMHRTHTTLLISSHTDSRYRSPCSFPSNSTCAPPVLPTRLYWWSLPVLNSSSVQSFDLVVLVLLLSSNSTLMSVPWYATLTHSMSVPWYSATLCHALPVPTPLRLVRWFPVGTNMNTMTLLWSKAPR